MSHLSLGHLSPGAMAGGRSWAGLLLCSSAPLLSTAIAVGGTGLAPVLLVMELRNWNNLNRQGGGPKPPGGRRLPMPTLLASLCLASALLLSGGLWGQELPPLRLKEEAAKEHFQRGLRFFNSHQYAASREFFYKALNIQPYFHLSRRYLGDAYYYSGDWDSALEQWEFLDEVSKGAYPLVLQRSQLLRRSIAPLRHYREYIYLRHYQGGPGGAYRMQRPTDLAVGEAGALYVVSFASANLVSIGAAGNVRWEVNGPFYDAFEGPLAVAVDGRERIYLCDYRDDRVRVFSQLGREIFSFGGAGALGGKFHGPAGIAVGEDAIFISDAGNQRIQRFNLQGEFLSSIAAPEGQSLDPAGLAVDPKAERLYVADRDGGRILLYSLEGAFIASLGARVLKRPRSIQVVDEETLLVADEAAGILFYKIPAQTWRPLGELRNEQDQAVRLMRPFSARLDPTGRLYVADYGANRVLVTVLRGLRLSNLDARIQKVDSQSFPEVALLVSLKNHAGSPIPDLPASSFLLYENGGQVANISIDGLKPYNLRQRILIAKENSPFFRRNLHTHARRSLAGLLAPLRHADRVIVMLIGKEVQTVYQGLERRRIMRYLVEGGEAEEGRSAEEPNFGKGLYSSIALLSKELGPRSINLVISGRHYAGAFSQYSIRRIIQYARANGVAINVISYESEDNDRLRGQAIEIYRGLAEQTGGLYMRGFGGAELSDLYDLSYKKRDTRYILAYKTFLNRDLAGHYVDLRLQINYSGSYGVADAGYFIPR